MENVGIPIIVIICYMIGEAYKLIFKNGYAISGTGNTNVKYASFFFFNFCNGIVYFI